MALLQWLVQYQCRLRHICFHRGCTSGLDESSPRASEIICGLVHIVFHFKGTTRVVGIVVYDLVFDFCVCCVEPVRRSFGIFISSSLPCLVG